MKFKFYLLLLLVVFPPMLVFSQNTTYTQNFNDLENLIYNQDTNPDIIAIKLENLATQIQTQTGSTKLNSELSLLFLRLWELENNLEDDSQTDSALKQALKISEKYIKQYPQESGGYRFKATTLSQMLPRKNMLWIISNVSKIGKNIDKAYEIDPNKIEIVLLKVSQSAFAPKSPGADPKEALALLKPWATKQEKLSKSQRYFMNLMLANLSYHLEDFKQSDLYFAEATKIYPQNKIIDKIKEQLAK